MRFTGKSVLITGAAQGICAQIAIRFAKEGANVAVADLNLNQAENIRKEIEALGRRAIAIGVDVRCEEQVKEMVRKTVNEFGTLDIMICGAGITRVAPVYETTQELWNETLDTNLKGTFFCGREASLVMIPKRSGRIINFSSKVGKTGGLSLSAYSASKSGIIGLTQAMALDLAPYKITVNAVCPGIVFTPQWDQLEIEYAKKLKIPREKVRDYYVSKIPLGRAGEPDDVANLVLFLASDEAEFMTGQAINITGGQEVH